MDGERRDKNRAEIERFISTAKADIRKACDFLEYWVAQANQHISEFNLQVSLAEEVLRNNRNPGTEQVLRTRLSNRLKDLEAIKALKLVEIKSFKRSKFKELSLAHSQEAIKLGIDIPPEADVHNSLLLAPVVVKGDVISLGAIQKDRPEAVLEEDIIERPEKKEQPPETGEPDELDRIINAELDEFGEKRGLLPKDLAGELDAKYREWLKRQGGNPDEPKPES